ncbi:MAG: hypothetical protein ACI8TX_003759 [Hyphomicrobiaceae bacterium]|jgi:hypothetical protein
MHFPTEDTLMIGTPIPTLAVLTIFLMGTATAWSADPVLKCEAGKLKAMGKYVACRAQTEAKAAAKDEAVDSAKLTKCADKFLGTWDKAELKAAGACGNPPGSDSTLAEATSTVYANWATEYAAGGEADICAGSCDQCTTDLATCEGDLTTCEASEGTCQGDLTTCSGSLSTCSGDLTTCQSDLTTCENQPAGGLPATGQAISYGTGSDGDVRAGGALSYTDNGDGTITDNNTGLMWEKKDDSGGIHDKDTEHTWSTGTNNMDGTITTTFLSTLNGGGGFAGHTDWRVPNLKELFSILDLQVSNPSIAPAFHRSATCTGCADVTVESCSCTQSSYYWSSSTGQDFAGNAWYVYFGDGFTSAGGKTGGRYVRAVRGGL